MNAFLTDCTDCAHCSDLQAPYDGQPEAKTAVQTAVGEIVIGWVEEARMARRIVE